MKTIKGFVSALLLMILLNVTNEFYFKIDQFLIGWFCCLTYLIVAKRMKYD